MQIQYLHRRSRSGVININACVIAGNLGKTTVLGCQHAFLLLHFSSMQICVFSQAVPCAQQKRHLQDNLVPWSIFARILSIFFLMPLTF